MTSFGYTSHLLMSSAPDSLSEQKTVWSLLICSSIGAQGLLFCSSMSVLKASPLPQRSTRESTSTRPLHGHLASLLGDQKT